MGSGHLDEIFEHDSNNRTPSTAKDLVGPAWRAISNPLAEVDQCVDSIESQIRIRNGLWRHAVQPGSPEEAKLAFDFEDYSRLARPGSEEEARILKDSKRFVTSYFKHEDPSGINPIVDVP